MCFFPPNFSKGEKLFNYARGICGQQIQSFKRRKSIGLDVNYAVRFDDTSEILVFIERLCVELHKRLKGRRGKHLTLKVMIKQPGWTNPTKFMGHGKCDSHQKSFTFQSFVADIETLSQNAKLLYRKFQINDPTDLVGIGISLGKLDDPVMDNVKSAESKSEMMEEMFRTNQPSLESLNEKVSLKTNKNVNNKYLKLAPEDIDQSILDELGDKYKKELQKELESLNPKAKKQRSINSDNFKAPKLCKSDEIHADVWSVSIIHFF